MPTSTGSSPLQRSRIILYHQTHHRPNGGSLVSVLPLITHPTGLTHLILAAFHINETPGDITLNDESPSASRNAALWSEMSWLRARGVKVLAMLGGAAKGTYQRLDTEDRERFEAYYIPLRDVLRSYEFSGIDLDIEEPVSLDGCIRLIDRIRTDFGPDFLITLAPVATGLLVGHSHLSGPLFSYHELERRRGGEVAWYNTQFYNGWGDATTSAWYEAILATGWKAEKIVMGLLTNPANGGSGFVELDRSGSVIRAIRARHEGFGGVMGWEYFNALPGGEQRPWEWAEVMNKAVIADVSEELVAAQQQQQQQQQLLTRPYGALIEQLPPPQHPYPAESMKILQDLGFTQQQAIAALNSTNGSVEYAAALLFAD